MSWTVWEDVCARCGHHVSRHILGPGWLPNCGRFEPSSPPVYPPRDPNAPYAPLRGTVFLEQGFVWAPYIPKIDVTSKR